MRITAAWPIADPSHSRSKRIIRARPTATILPLCSCSSWEATSTEGNRESLQYANPPVTDKEGYEKMWKEIALGLALTTSVGELAYGQGSLTSAKSYPASEIAASVEQVTKQTDSAVVEIEVERWFLSDSNAEPDRVGYLLSDHVVATGTILTGDGFIVTNHHVIKSAKKIAVKLSGESSVYVATLVGTDADTDLALLKIDASGLNHFDLQTVTVPAKGELVLALGNPFGFSHSVALGVVSSPNRELGDAPTPYIQTDASLNPGNSGGPLIDLKGRLLGINTLLFSYSGGSEGVGFAIPASTVKRVIDLLKEQGRVDRPHLGLVLQRLSPSIINALELNVKTGLLVADVDAGGAAEAAGLRPGDVIVAVNDGTVASYSDFVRNMSELRPGGEVRLSLMRDKHPLQVRVLPEYRSSLPQNLLDAVDPKRDAVERIGVLAINFDRDLRMLLSHPRFEDGAVIVARYGIPTGAAELKPGDILHQLNGAPIHSVADLRRTLQNIDSDAPLVFQVERNGELSYIAVEDE